MATEPDRKRDFLWREEAPGRLPWRCQSRPPVALDDLFELGTKEFAPALSAGDGLGFSLRANPVIARSESKGQRGKRHDVVFDALRRIPQAERAGQRLDVLSVATRSWLDRQAAAHGFVVEGVAAVDGYQRASIPREGAKNVVFGRVDISGRLTVSGPGAVRHVPGGRVRAVSRVWVRAYADQAGMTTSRPMPGLPPPRPIPVRDRASILFVEKGRLDVLDGAFVLVDEAGIRTHIPFGGLACLMLEPGIRITHAAVALAARVGLPARVGR